MSCWFNAPGLTYKGMVLVSDLANGTRDETGRFRPSLRRTLDNCGPLLGLPDDEQPPLFRAAAQAVSRGLRKPRRPGPAARLGGAIPESGEGHA